MKRTVRFIDPEQRYSPSESRGDEIWPVSARRKAPPNFRCIRGCGCFFKERCWDYDNHSEDDKADWAEEKELRAKLRSLDRKKQIARLQALQHLDENRSRDRVDAKNHISRKGTDSGGLTAEKKATKKAPKASSVKGKENASAAALDGGQTKEPSSPDNEREEKAAIAKGNMRRVLWQRYTKYMDAKSMANALLKRSRKFKATDKDGVEMLREKMLKVFEDHDLMWTEHSWEKQGPAGAWVDPQRWTFTALKLDPAGPQPPAPGSPKPPKSGAKTETAKQRRERVQRVIDDSNAEIQKEKAAERAAKATVSVSAVTAAVAAGYAEDKANVCHVFCQEQGIPWDEDWMKWCHDKRVAVVQGIQHGQSWHLTDMQYDRMMEDMDLFD